MTTTTTNPTTADLIWAKLTEMRQRMDELEARLEAVERKLEEARA